MTTAHLDHIQIKQPASIELYLDKIKEMKKRTLIQYELRWASLLKQGKPTLAENIKSAVESVINDARSHKIKPATYRLYKAAICYGLASIYLKLENDLVDDSELDSGLNIQLLSTLYKEINSQKIEFLHNSEYEPRTSAMKKKSFPEKFYKYLLKENQKHENSANLRLSLLMQFVNANLVVGLRPIEWLDVTICSNIENKNLVFLVRNAKNSNGRANGVMRELHLIDATADQQLSVLGFYSSFHKRLHKSVERFLKIQAEFESKDSYETTKEKHVFNLIFDDFKPSVYENTPLSDICDKYNRPQNGLAEIVLNSLQNEMYFQFNAFLEIEPDTEQKRVSLYSTRHQCIANAKASKVNPYVIAAFFGHSSKETSSRHYGKAWSGWSKFTFKPSLESIKAVHGSSEYLNITKPEVAVDNTVQNPLDLDF